MRAAALLPLLLPGGASTCVLKADKLRVDGRDAPVLAVAGGTPLVSWRLSTTAAATNGQAQSAYRIQAAPTPEFSSPQWDTGRVNSSDTLQIPYAGTALQPMSVVYFRVSVWDADGAECGWSDVQSWEMTLGDGDWEGSWLRRTPQPSSGSCSQFADDEFSAPRFRSDITLPSAELVKARVYVTGLGYYRLWIDGQRIGSSELDPALSVYSKRVLYAVYDVTSALAGGTRHAVGVEVGNGWWNPLPMLFWGHLNLSATLNTGSPMFRLELRAFFKDGSVYSLSSDAQKWKVGPGPTLFNNIYLGERYDARLEEPGWSTVGFNDSAWESPEAVSAPGVGRLEPQTAPPVRRVANLTATIVRTTRYSNGSSLVLMDAGKNHAGACSFTASGPAGSTLRMRYGELLYADGTLNVMTSVAGQVKGPNPKQPCQPDVAYQRDLLVLGAGTTQWSPAWSWHGFRYFDIEVPSGVTVHAVTCHPMRSDMPTVTTFESSDPALSTLRQLNRNTYDSNLMGVQSDCPHRERFGYTGDALGSGEAGLSIYDMSLFDAKRTADYSDAARSNGGFTETAPFVGIDDAGLGGGTGSIGWETVQPSMLLWLYRYFGDERSVREHFNASRRYVELLDTRPAGITKGLGDWMPVEKTDVRLTGLGFLRESYVTFANLSSIIGEADLAKEYRAKADDVAAEINTKFLDPSGAYGPPAGFNGTQTGQGMALFMGIVPESKRQAALQVMVDNAKGASYVPGSGQGPKKGGPGPHMLAGLFGVKWFLMSLADGGEQDLAYEVLTTTSYPSFLWMMNNEYDNATTIWESWFFSDNTYSHNHPMFSSSEVWMLQSLAGVQPHPAARGMDRILVRPRPPMEMARRAPGGKAWVKASYETVRGTVSVSWELRVDKAFSLNVTVPPNMHAHVIPPCGAAEFVVGGTYSNHCTV
eukprot:TRINITY_DN30832_c0_g1_i1.p1 TRINITY_DN30832_c0_g1~~TRINITY_DN30832_c0_g1_i1.p1  ORF type:complete len:944 (+),score=232.22 TRINITY_DN30832_c0_g1_i1:49-2832(+)